MVILNSEQVATLLSFLRRGPVDSVTVESAPGGVMVTTWFESGAYETRLIYTDGKQTRKVA